jgi:hypothetical protein
MSAMHRTPLHVDVVNIVRNRREVMLERPPFCTDGSAWKSAVDLVRDMRRRGVSTGEPFIAAMNYYRHLGGGFAS